MRTYDELMTIESFIDRFRYLKLDSNVGEETFGFDRYLNQIFYHSKEWENIKNFVIARDLGCDLAFDGFEIHGRIYVHHMNPISKRDILDRSKFLLDPNYLICTSFDTHNAIHYSDENLLRINSVVLRTKNDTCPWKK